MNKMRKVTETWSPLLPILIILRKMEHHHSLSLLYVCIVGSLVPMFSSPYGDSSSRRRSMIIETASRNAASLVPGSTDSCASWTICSITDSFFKVSLHIMLPMMKGVSPLSAPFFRSMVEMRRVRAHSSGKFHPWNFRSSISFSASSDLM